MIAASIIFLLFMIACTADAAVLGNKTIVDCKKYEVLINGQCTRCDTCNIGQGFDQKCGYGLPVGGAECRDCIDGETYNDQPDHRGVCADCTKCEEQYNRTVKRHCRRSINTECGGCLDGYYDYHRSKGWQGSHIQPCFKCKPGSEHPECVAHFASTVAPLLGGKIVDPLTKALTTRERHEGGLQWYIWLIIAIAICVLLCVLCFCAGYKMGQLKAKFFRQKFTGSKEDVEMDDKGNHAENPNRETQPLIEVVHKNTNRGERQDSMCTTSSDQEVEQLIRKKDSQQPQTETKIIRPVPQYLRSFSYPGATPGNNATREPLSTDRKVETEKVQKAQVCPRNGSDDLLPGCAHTCSSPGYLNEDGGSFSHSSPNNTGISQASTLPIRGMSETSSGVPAQPMQSLASQGSSAMASNQDFATNIAPNTAIQNLPRETSTPISSFRPVQPNLSSIDGSSVHPASTAYSQSQPSRDSTPLSHTSLTPDNPGTFMYNTTSGYSSGNGAAGGTTGELSPMTTTDLKNVRDSESQTHHQRSAERARGATPPRSLVYPSEENRSAVPSVPLLSIRGLGELQNPLGPTAQPSRAPPQPVPARTQAILRSGAQGAKAVVMDEVYRASPRLLTQPPTKETPAVPNTATTKVPIDETKKKKVPTATLR